MKNIPWPSGMTWPMTWTAIADLRSSFAGRYNWDKIQNCWSQLRPAKRDVWKRWWLVVPWFEEKEIWFADVVFFKIRFMFIPKIGGMIQFHEQIFSDGLVQPPTSFWINMWLIRSPPLYIEWYWDVDALKIPCFWHDSTKTSCCCSGGKTWK